MTKPTSLNKTILNAVADITLFGYTQARLLFWQNQIRRAIPGSKLTQAYLTRVFGNKLNRIVKKHARFTLANVNPRLHAELNSRIVASAELIKLNRDVAINKTLQRFSGWATSIPDGGSTIVDKNKIKADIAKPIKQFSFEERRVAIDQGHKLVGTIEEIVAVDDGAIGGYWQDQGEHDPSYDARKDHLRWTKEEIFFVVPDNWAIKQGLINTHKITKGPVNNNKFYWYDDSVEKVGQAVYCSCFMRWVYNLNKLPPELLTEKFKNASH